LEMVRQILWQTTRLRKEGPRTEESKSQFCLIRYQKQLVLCRRNTFHKCVHLSPIPLPAEEWDGLRGNHLESLTKCNRGHFCFDKTEPPCLFNEFIRRISFKLRIITPKLSLPGSPLHGTSLTLSCHKLLLII